MIEFVLKFDTMHPQIPTHQQQFNSFLCAPLPVSVALLHPAVNGTITHSNKLCVG